MVHSINNINDLDRNTSPPVPVTNVDSSSRASTSVAQSSQVAVNSASASTNPKMQAAAASDEPIRQLKIFDGSQHVFEEIALAYDEPCFLLNEEMEGYVTSGEEWISFYFQCRSTNDLLQEIQLSMNELYEKNEFPSITETVAFSVGSPCAARYTKDNHWYRARIKDVSYNLVQFVDYGNTQMCSLQNVKPLTRPLAEFMPPVALHCKLTSFQNVLLPSFAKEGDLVRLMILSKSEPHEVSVKVMETRNNSLNTRPQEQEAAAVNPFSESKNSNDSRRRTTPQGLTLPDKSPKFVDLEDEEEEKRLKKPTAKSFGGKFVLSNVTGAVTESYATSGTIVPEGNYRNTSMFFNCEQTTLMNGVLSVDNLSRIFKQNDRLTCCARFDDPLINTQKGGQIPVGYYQVTNITDVLNSKKVLISHGTVTYVTNDGAIIYTRDKEQHIFAPASAFPPGKTESDLSEILQVGRSVLIRALPADQFFDLQVTADWVAAAVEFLGGIVEEQGYMYFVRDEYSVIITDGNIGFGYVFVWNELVDAVGVKKEEWAGTRAMFRACIDIPDSEKNRTGVRWKGLKVVLDPAHSKGPYRYPGIYRPPPAYVGEGTAAAAGGGAGTKKYEDVEGEDGGGDLELPEEVLAELRYMNKDVIGINRLKDPTQPKREIREVTENLLNEQEEVPAELLYATASIGCGNTKNGRIVNEESEIEITMLDVANTSNPQPYVDLLGLSDLVDNPSPPLLPSTFQRTSSADLLELWQGDSDPFSIGFADNSSTDSPAFPLLQAPLMELYTKTAKKEKVVEASTKDAGCQLDEKTQILVEIRALKEAKLLGEVVQYVATLPKVEQQQFYKHLMEESSCPNDAK